MQYTVPCAGSGGISTLAFWPWCKTLKRLAWKVLTRSKNNNEARLTNTYKTWRDNENSYKIVSGPKAVLEFLVPISSSFEWFSIAYKTALEKRSWAETFTDTEEKTGRRFNFNEPESGVRGRQAVTCLPHRVIDFLFWYLKDIMYKSYLILDHLTINNSPAEENSTKNEK